MKTGDTFPCDYRGASRGSVVRLIKQGGEGAVYEVAVQGERMALKDFKSQLSDRRIAAFRELIAAGPPHEAFVFPLAVVRLAGGFIALLMTLIASAFCEISELVHLPAERRPSLRNAVLAAITIARAFHALIRRGGIYVDISSGQILVSPEGHVRICDVMNIVERVTADHRLMTLRYTDPELWKGKVLPSVATGRFSLAVVFFELLCSGHPLLGKKLPRIAGPADEDRLLHDSPVFVFDPDNDSNRPDPEEHAEVLVYWEILTVKVRQMFTRQFTVGLRDPNQRAVECEWIDALTDMYSGGFTCDCGAEVFHDPYNPAPACWNCRRPLPRPPRLKFRHGREVVLKKDLEITRYDVLGREAYDFSPVGRIVGDELRVGSVELLNLSGGAWRWRRRGCLESEVPPGAKVPLMGDVTISFGRGLTATVAM
jgi:DNA-binding helix-hairpin-helix protein with protein kinase domain